MNSSQPYSPGGFQFMPPAIKAIILLNIAVFLLQLTPFGDTISTIGALWPVGSGNFRIWQPVTYMFLHGGYTHLLLNMFALWMFGAEIETQWGTRQFNIYYFVCGIGAAIINLIATMGNPYPTVGASGAIYSVLLAFGMMFPNRYIFLYFFFPVKAKFFITGYALIEFVSGFGSRLMGNGSNIAHFAHLGGMLIGFIFITIKRTDFETFSLSETLANFGKKISSAKISLDPIKRVRKQLTNEEEVELRRYLNANVRISRETLIVRAAFSGLSFGWLMKMNYDDLGQKDWGWAYLVSHLVIGAMMLYSGSDATVLLLGIMVYVGALVHTNVLLTEKVRVATERFLQEKKTKCQVPLTLNKVVPPVSESEINAILDKISEHGYASLTHEERRKLLKASGKR